MMIISLGKIDSPDPIDRTSIYSSLDPMASACRRRGPESNLTHPRMHIKCIPPPVSLMTESSLARVARNVISQSSLIMVTPRAGDFLSSDVRWSGFEADLINAIHISSGNEHRFFDVANRNKLN